MKQVFCLSVLMSLPFAASHAANSKKVQQLPLHSMSVPAAHLTTRIEWRAFPQPKYNNQDLQNANRSAVVRIYADATGQVTDAHIQDSTGIAKLDQALIIAVKKAEIKPHIENNNAMPVIGYQVFNLNMTNNEQAECTLAFESQNWQAQQAGKKTAFRYLSQPQIDAQSAQLKGYDRQVKFSFKANKHGDIKKVKIKQGSGVYALDQKVIQAVQNSQVSVKRSASTLWLYKKSHFKDEVKFPLNTCL